MTTATPPVTIQTGYGPCLVQVEERYGEFVVTLRDGKGRLVSATDTALFRHGRD